MGPEPIGARALADASAAAAPARTPPKRTVTALKDMGTVPERR